MTFTSSSSSQNSTWSSPSAAWLRQRDAMVILSHKKSSLKQLSFSDSPISNHTKNAIVLMN
jgi:hypothetical protein